MFKAIGTVITLVAIRVLMPDVFYAAEHALLTFFNLLGDIVAHPPTTANIARDLSQMSAAGYIPRAAPLPRY